MMKSDICSKRESLFTGDPVIDLNKVLKELKHQILLTPKEENISAPGMGYTHHLPAPGWYT